MKQSRTTTDDKIREYVLRKQQQRDRARQLREARNSQSKFAAPEPHHNTGARSSFSQQRRIIGDPFAPNPGPESNNFTQTKNDETPWNDTLHQPPAPPRRSFSNNNAFDNTWSAPSMNSAMNASYATVEDMKAVQGLVHQLQGQMHNLQFQIDNLKYDNQRLKDKIQEMQQGGFQPPPNREMPNQQFQNRGGHSMSNGKLGLPPTHPNKTQFSNPGISSSSRHSSRQHSRQTSPPSEQIKSGRQAMDVDTDQDMSRRNDFFSNKNDFSSGQGSGVNSGRASFSFKDDSSNRMRGHSSSTSPPAMNGVGKSDNMFGGRDKKFGGHTSKNFMNDDRLGSATSSDRSFGSNVTGSNRLSNRPTNHQPLRRNNPEPMDIAEEDEENQAPPPSTAEDLLKNLTEDAFAVDNEVRIPCSQCGRKFVESALEKHARICKKVFQKKRKAFDVKKQRVDREMQQASQDNSRVPSRGPRGGRGRGRGRGAKKPKGNKWKNQSSALRDAIRAAREVAKAQKEGRDLSTLPIRQSTVPDTRVPCPYCGRKFSEEAADRHIPKCKNIKSRPKPIRRNVRNRG